MKEKSKSKKWGITKNVGNEKDGKLGIGRASNVGVEASKLNNGT